MTYQAEDIYVLEGLEPVRKRPAMYIGSTGPGGLHHLVFEAVDNSVDEALAGFCTFIEVELTSEGAIRVTDNGRGIPIETHPQTKKSALETVMTMLHAGGKFGSKSYRVSGGLHGVGISVVNALSLTMRAEVKRHGKLYVQEYKLGAPQGPVKETGEAKGTGTTVIFKPDNTIFDTVAFSAKTILTHLRRQAYLTPKVHIRVLDNRLEEARPSVHNFYFEGGAHTYLQTLTRGHETDHANEFFISQTKDEMVVEAGFQYVNDSEGTQLSFANNIVTPQGGTHLTGFRAALTRVCNAYADEKGFFSKEDEHFSPEDQQEGLIALVSVKLSDPQFEGQTKEKLGNRSARGTVEAVVGEALAEFFKRHPEDAGAIIRKLLLVQKARKKAQAVKQTILRKGALAGLRLPGKLTDCFSRNPEESELFIVEGNSAGGSAKMARDPKFQAILPLRGKILNVEKARLAKMLSSVEIQAIIIALGTAISEEFDLSRLRYHKTIIMADADSDGAHIETLLLTLFFRHFQPLIEKGYLYLAQPPLYRISKGKKVAHAFNDEERDEIMKTQFAGEQKVDIQRYKGLGEMNPKQLWDTTMDPETRILKQVIIEDAVAADRMFDILLGDEVKTRRKFIQAHSRQVINLDI